MTIPRVYACACAHIREGFFSFALVCRYLGRFRLEIRRRYYCTAYFPLKDFRLEVYHLLKHPFIKDLCTFIFLFDVVGKQEAQQGYF